MTDCRPVPSLRSPVMKQDGRGAHAPSPRRSRRNGPTSEARLRALGKEIDSPGVPVGARSAKATRDGKGSGRVANEHRLRALEEEIRRSGSRRRPPRTRSRRRRRLRTGILISLAVLVLLVGGGAGYAYYLTHDLNRVEVRGLNGVFTTGQESGTENILMVGSTSRCALTQQNAAYGLCSEGVNGVNSDVIMILHVDPANHRLALISIPRDLFIPNARTGSDGAGAYKIDAALYEGLTQVAAAIEEDFGIPIQHAVSLNFDQFANIVDALGGINMSFPMSVYDAYSGLDVQAARCVHLDGTQALQVVRARELQYDAPGTTSLYASDWPKETLSDLARIRRDHEFLRVLASAMAKRGLENPITDIDLINSVKADLTFDQSWSVTDMANLVIDFHSVNVNAVPQLTLPVAVVNDPAGTEGDLIYDGENKQEVEFPAQSQDQSIIDQVLGITANTDSMTGDPLPNPSTVTVSVMNGSGAANQATDTATSLAALGYHISGAGNTTPTGDVAETVVYYGSRDPTTEAAAESVVRSMTGSVVMAYDPSQVADGAQVTVVTGTQFTVNAPATAAPAPSATTATPSTTVAPTTGAIAAPSSANMKLQPWDPRACPAGAIPTAPVRNPIH